MGLGRTTSVVSATPTKVPDAPGSVARDYPPAPPTVKSKSRTAGGGDGKTEYSRKVEPDDEEWATRHKQVIGDKQMRGRHGYVPVVASAVKVFVEQVSVETKWTLMKSVVVDSTLSQVLQEAGKKGMEVLDIFNPPDSLISGFGTTHTNLQIFMRKATYKGPTQFCVKDITLPLKGKNWLGEDPPPMDLSPIENVMAQFGAKNYALGGIYDPPSLRPSWNRTTQTASLQLIFQRPYLCPSPHPPTYTYLTVPMTCVVRHSSTEIVELTPTLNDLANQGFRLSGTFNPPVSRMRQSRGLPSVIYFYFESPSETSSSPPRYLSTVVKGQMTVTNVSFGVKVRGQYVHSIREYSKAGWTLATIIDVPDSVVAGLTTVYLVFETKLQVVSPTKKKQQQQQQQQANASRDNANRDETASVTNGGYPGSSLHPHQHHDLETASVASSHLSSPAPKINASPAITPTPSAMQHSPLQSKRANNALGTNGGNKGVPAADVVARALRKETASRLFRKPGDPPEPDFVYAHNLYAKLEEEQTAVANAKGAFCGCCAIL